MVKEPSLKSRIILYPLMAGLFLIGCYFIALLAFGYNFKFVEGKLIKEKTGTILLSSRPGDAKVTIDGQLYPKKTPNLPFFYMKIDRVKAGNHRVMVEKEGYETWDGQFNVEPGMVSWGNYLLFLPKKIETTAYNFTNIKDVITSKDQSKEFITTFQQETGILTFWEINTGNKVQRKLLEKKLGANESYSPVSYSTDEERLLMLHKRGTETGYEVFEVRENGRFWNLSTTYKEKIENPVFNPRNHDELYILKDKKLININFQLSSWEQTKDQNVLGMYPTESDMLLVINTDGNYGLWRIAQNGNSQVIIKNLPVSESYQITSLPEENSYAVLDGKTKDLLLYVRDSNKYSLKKIDTGVEWFLASPRSKYIAYSKDNTLKSYEVEKERHLKTLDISPGKLTWAEDESNLFYLNENEIRMVNFNGYYNKKISEAKSGKILISNSYNLFFIKENPDKKSDDVHVFGFNLSF